MLICIVCKGIRKHFSKRFENKKNITSLKKQHEKDKIHIEPDSEHSQGTGERGKSVWPLVQGRGKRGNNLQLTVQVQRY